MNSLSNCFTTIDWNEEVVSVADWLGRYQVYTPCRHVWLYFAFAIALRRFAAAVPPFNLRRGILQCFRDPGAPIPQASAGAMVPLRRDMLFLAELSEFLCGGSRLNFSRSLSEAPRQFATRLEFSGFSLLALIR